MAYEMTMWKAADGTLFTTLEQAEQYEKAVLVQDLVGRLLETYIKPHITAVELARFTNALCQHFDMTRLPQEEVA